MDLQLKIRESKEWVPDCWSRSKSIASFESVSIFKLERIFWLIARFSPVKIAYNSFWKGFSMPIYLENLIIQSSIISETSPSFQNRFVHGTVSVEFNPWTGGGCQERLFLATKITVRWELPGEVVSRDRNKCRVGSS